MFAAHRIVWGRLVGILVFAYVLVAAPPTFFAPWVSEAEELTGFVLLCAAAFGRIWCLIYIAGKKNRILLTDGPYSIVRNPLYVFSFLGAIGFGLTVENPVLAIALAIVFAVFHAFAVRGEEEHLAAEYGVEFQDYCTRTPRWIPNFWLYREAESVSVNPAKIRAGILDATWFVWAFLLWEVLEECRRMGLLTTLI